MKNEGKKIYVNGGMLITTPFFSYKNAGCFWSTPPEGAEQIECDETKEGVPYIIIDENKALSIFNEYYAKDFLTTYCLWAPFLSKSNDDNYKEYLRRIAEVYELTKIPNISVNMKQIIFRQVYLGVVASVETFVCDTILFKISNSKEEFCKYINSEELYKVSKKERKSMIEALNRMWCQNEMGNAEQKVFDYVINTSYSNINKIKLIYKLLFGIAIYDTDKKMEQHFNYRHLIAHKNGRKKNGEIDILTEKDIDELISDANVFIKQIKEKL